MEFKRAKTAEAEDKVKRIYEGARAYWQDPVYDDASQQSEEADSD